MRLSHAENVETDHRRATETQFPGKNIMELERKLDNLSLAAFLTNTVPRGRIHFSGVFGLPIGGDYLWP